MPAITNEERGLLQRLGLPRVRVWPPRADWYTEDGKLVPNRPCDPYSRLLYLSRNMRPDLWRNKHNPSTKAPRVSVTLLDAIVALGNSEGTGTDLYERLKMTTDDLPDSPSRLSREIARIEAQLKVRRVTVERERNKSRRLIRLRHNS